MIEKTVRMSLLFDFYGQLLTERQQEFFSLYYDDDLSLGEIASQYGVSRQAVYDILKRSTQALEDFESKLALVERYTKRQSSLAELDTLLVSLLDDLASLDAPRSLREKVERARALIGRVEARDLEG